jgi:hypothetical protein
MPFVEAKGLLAVATVVQERVESHGIRCSFNQIDPIGHSVGAMIAVRLASGQT